MRRSRQRNRGPSNRLFITTIIVVTIVAIISGGFFIKNVWFKDHTPPESSDHSSFEKNNESSSKSKHDGAQDQEESYTNIELVATGDIMFHDSQIESAYDPETDTYDFHPMFKDVKPILEDADLTLANFETTTAGSSIEYTGYPMFNSPDEVIDAVKDAGIDVLTTANNHSLDTRDEGLKRTVKKLREREIDTVGTYDEEPDSRVLVKEVDGIKFAILSYTESTNGLGDQYSPEQLHKMINLMTEENIKRDIQEAKDLEADFIITFMHWGEEYMTEPNEIQREYAQLMAEEGVDLILGSHPHVIQESEVIEGDEKDTYVIYSMGNFLSNQRKETLGDEYENTEDGIIVHFDIQKNDATGETSIRDVEYTPTWVYRNKEEGDSTYTYRILPIENFLVSDEISDAYKARMERSYEETLSKMYEVDAEDEQE